MLRKFSASLFALCLVFVATPFTTSAQIATGKYNFILDDELMKYLEFDVKRRRTRCCHRLHGLHGRG